MGHKKQTGHLLGSANPRSVLTPEQVIFIFQSKDKVDYLAEVFNVSLATVYRIKRRQTWSHLTKHLSSERGRINAIRTKDVKRPRSSTKDK